MISITEKIAIDEREIEESFIRASGPGGQNVNKLNTAVQLRFDVRATPSLPEPVRARLARLAGSRLTKDGVLVCMHDTTLERTTNVKEVFPDRAKEVNGKKTWPVAEFC